MSRRNRSNVTTIGARLKQNGYCVNPVRLLPSTGMRRLLFAVAAGLGILYAALFGGPMDGTSWEVKIKPDSLLSFSHRDTLVFQRGRMSAAGFLSEGFSPAVYSARAAEGGLSTVWNAALTHAQDGIVSWNGLVRGDRIEGIAVWWTKGGGLKRFTFKGVRKAG